MNQNYEINFPQARAQSQSWILAAFVTFFCLVLAMASVRFVQPFATLFHGLGVDMPWPTRFLTATYSWFLPAYFLSLAVAAFTKEWLSSDFRLKRLISVRILLAAIVMIGVVFFVLYLPIITIAAKLSDKN